VLDLLAAARRVTTGDTALVGPGGERVVQARFTDRTGATVPLFRLTRNGQPVRDCRTVDELAQEVDLSMLVEEPGAEGAGGASHDQ
jgi:hypothetical protein